MATLAELHQQIKNDDRYIVVSETPQELPGVLQNLPNLQRFIIYVYEFDGQTGKESKLAIDVRDLGQPSEAAVFNNQLDGGPILGYGIQTIYTEAITKLMQITGAKVWRNIELNVERGYGDFKVFIESIPPNSPEAGSGEWKYYSVISEGSSYSVYELPNGLPVRSPDVRKIHA